MGTVHHRVEDQVQIVLSYQTRTSGHTTGGVDLMWRVAAALEEAGFTTFNGKQVPAG